MRLKSYEVAAANLKNTAMTYEWFEPIALKLGAAIPVDVGGDDTFYVCRARLKNNGEYHPGKAEPLELETCYVGYGHKEKHLDTVTILSCDQN